MIETTVSCLLAIGFDILITMTKIWHDYLPKFVQMERNISEWNTIGPQIDPITPQNGIKSVRLTDSKIAWIIFFNQKVIYLVIIQSCTRHYKYMYMISETLIIHTNPSIKYENSYSLTFHL